MNIYTTVLVSFPTGGCIDEFDNNRANYQGYEYNVYFLLCHTLKIKHFMNGEAVC